ncbi:MAG: hypothetical protein U0T81_14200 [Saprospiraceae bacterium]
MVVATDNPVADALGALTTRTNVVPRLPAALNWSVRPIPDYQWTTTGNWVNDCNPVGDVNVSSYSAGSNCHTRSSFFTVKNTAPEAKLHPT